MPPLADGVPNPAVPPTAAPLETRLLALMLEPVWEPSRPSERLVVPGVLRPGMFARSEDSEALASDVKRLMVDSLSPSPDSRLLPASTPSAIVRTIATASCVHVPVRTLRRLRDKDLLRDETKMMGLSTAQAIMDLR